MALPSWVPDDETKPAPMPLLVVQSFVNTWEGDSGTDLLADPASAGRWLRDAGLLDAAEVETRTSPRPGELREAHPRPARPQRRRRCARTARRSTRWRHSPRRCRLRPVVLADGSVELRPERRVRDERPGHAAPHHPRRPTRRDLATAQGLPEPGLPVGLLRPLPRGRGAWCDMAVCGNRIKNRNLRSRRTGWRPGATGAEVPGEAHGPGRRRGQGGDARTGQRRQAQRTWAPRRCRS